jgi:hypothetical protein
MPPGGAIEGYVLDESGEPVAGAAVQVLRQRYVNGLRRLAPTNVRKDVTDDLGRFRLHGLPPGEYFVVAEPPMEDSGPGTVTRISPGGVAGTTTTFYPGTASVGRAQPLVIAMGQVQSRIVVPLVSVPLATISGVALRSDGSPAETGIVSVTQSRTTGGTYNRMDGVITGSFSIAHLPPGEYTVMARLHESESAVARVTLDGTDVSVTLTAGKEPRARGRIRANPGTALAELSPTAVRIVMQSLDDMPRFDTAAPSTASEDWTFDVPAIAGRVLIRTTLPSGWNLERVTRGGVNVTDVPVLFQKDVDGLEIVLTRRTTLLSGTVSDRTGTRMPDSTVVVFADDPARWGPFSRFVRAARPDREGRFAVIGLPPGRYRAIALDYLEPGEETNPQTLESLHARGAELSLGDGETRAIDLKLTERP